MEALAVSQERVEWRLKQRLSWIVFQAEGSKSRCGLLTRLLLVIHEKTARFPVYFALLCPRSL